MAKTLLELAHDGRTAEIEGYFGGYGKDRAFHANIRKLLDAMLAMPGEFKNADVTAKVIADNSGVIGRKFDFGMYFSSDKALRAQMIWKAHALNPTLETARMGAILAAEYLKVRFLADMAFRQDFANLFTSETGDGGLSLTDEANRTAIRNSVIAIQNALVDYVRDEGQGKDIGHAPVFLSVVSAMGDADPETAKLWTDKITDISVLSGYSLTEGDILKAAPVYAPTSGPIL